MFLYRHLAVEGLKGFTDAYYLGAFPMPGQEGLFDVLVAPYRGVETWFYFDPHGQLAVMEIYVDEHQDPWQVHFGKYHTADGHDLPGRIAVQATAGSTFQIDFDQFHFTDEAKK